jgi:hypothetical protein
MGHADVRTTVGHAHLAKEHLAVLVERFGLPEAGKLIV